MERALFDPAEGTQSAESTSTQHRLDVRMVHEGKRLAFDRLWLGFSPPRGFLHMALLLMKKRGMRPLRKTRRGRRRAVFPRGAARPSPSTVTGGRPAGVGGSEQSEAADLQAKELTNAKKKLGWIRRDLRTTSRRRTLQPGRVVGRDADAQARPARAAAASPS